MGLVCPKSDPQAITAHDHGPFLLVLIQERAVHSLRIVGTQLEDVPQLYARHGIKVCLAALGT